MTWRNPRKKHSNASQGHDSGSTELQKSGQLAGARTKYAESQALIETKDVTEAISI